MANIWHRAGSAETVSRQELVKRSAPPRHEDTETSCLGAFRLHRGMSAGFGLTLAVPGRSVFRTPRAARPRTTRLPLPVPRQEPGSAGQPELTRSGQFSCSARRDAVGPAVAVDKTDPPVAGRPPAVADSNARTEDWRGVSPIGAAALPQIGQGFFRQRIETTRGGIFLNLAVPPSSVELGEPRPERGEFRGGKSTNGILDFPNRAHVTKLTPLGRPAQSPWSLGAHGNDCRHGIPEEDLVTPAFLEGRACS